MSLHRSFNYVIDFTLCDDEMSTGKSLICNRWTQTFFRDYWYFLQFTPTYKLNAWAYSRVNKSPKTSRIRTLNIKNHQ